MTRFAPTLLFALFIACSAAAAPPVPPAARAEIAHLLGYLADSGCRFYRNGAWHDAAAARAHLTRKYDYLARRALVKRAEDFIRKAASASSMSGEPYRVQCPGAAPVRSDTWLTEELQRRRAVLSRQ